MKTKIYVGDDYRLLDMFDDESIQITSKLSDIEKLSNVFNDYSNSFTVPATPNNSAIFKHYYDWDIDNGFNANIAVNGYIEIDTIPFKFGKIQLEDVVVKGHRPSTYKITFFGSLRQLSDIFGADTIDRLDYTRNEDGTETKTLNTLSQFDYDYTNVNFLDTLNNPSFKDGNIITPLIAYADRDWAYGTYNEIDISGGPEGVGAILDSELRPSIRIYNILLAIEAKYDISFSRDFFGKAVFNNLFIWMNAYTNFDIGKQEQEPNITTAFVGTNDGSVVIDGNYIEITRRKYTTSGEGRFIARWFWRIDPANTSIKYDAFIVDGNNNKIKSYYKKSGLQEFNISLEADYGTTTEMTSDRFKLVLVPTQTLEFSMAVSCRNFRFTSGGVEIVYANLLSNPNDMTLLVAILIEKHMPRMSVIDFFQGIMKMFKLIIRPISENQFYVDTIDGYYSRGSMLNISEYVDNTSVLIERPLIYRTLKFLYQKTDNILGKQFRQRKDPSRDEFGYGDLISTFLSIKNTDELKVELPFENMLFERLVVQQPNANAGDLTNIVIGQSATLSDDGTTVSKRQSKPILFFNNGISTNIRYPFKTKFQEEYATTPYPYIIGNSNDALLYQITDTINFGSEIDPWHLTQIENSLYLNYWENWVNTIYSLRQRKLTYTANLPARFVHELSLNDRILIGDSRFKINDFTVDIPTGKTKLTLFNDIFAYAPPQPVVAITGIEANAGTKYYGIPLNTESSWYVSLIDEGFGTDWIEVLTPSGTGSTEVVIRVLEKASQVPPAVYLSRAMTINIWVGTEAYSILLTQYGLGD